MGRLYAYALFHLNLAFSSIEEEARGTVIARCYWPLLRLARATGLPIGIEASAWTLREIAARDPAWISELRALADEGLVEFVGSGYAQVIGPLVPADVVAANLGLGRLAYEEMLGRAPTLALVNEQAYSAGLVEAYVEAGYRAILMDWDGTACHHPEWPREMRHLPQRALGTGGAAIDLVWLSTIAFQKAQRLAHGESSLETYTRFVERQAGETVRAFPLYGNDAEIFDFRPGRFRTEAALAEGPSEWARLEAGFRAVAALSDVAFVPPSAVLGLMGEKGAGIGLTLETPACPVPVKKQHKYNVTRWAVSGRDDLGANTACRRIHGAMTRDPARADWRRARAEWESLLELWASDVRTHITPARWTRFKAAVEGRPEARSTAPPPRGRMRPAAGTLEEEGRLLTVATPAGRMRLNLRKGLAIDALWLGPGDNAPLVGTLPHGFYEDIGFGADWYSGTAIYEIPLRPKVTDLAPVEPEIREDEETGAIEVAARIATPLGPIEKRLTLCADRPELKCRLTMSWEEWPHGSLRLGNITLNPEAFDPETLYVRTHNGGRRAETFALAGETVDHGAPVSFLVSARTGMGMTEGRIELGDASRRIVLTADMELAALIGLLTHRPVDDTFFCRVALSALELDETRNAQDVTHGPRSFAYTLSA
ncbi:MAG: glycoside hydrolase family 57 [Alphaproteobacteria bacterium]|nr:glycoside hydrolase family 57 [Alphaproteobacteria bacterium]